MLKDRIAKNIRDIPLSPIRKIYEIVTNNPGIINFTSGEPDFDAPIHVLDALKEAVDEGYTHYSSTFGLPEFREAVANYYRRYKQVDVEPDNVLVMCGSSHAIYVIMNSILNKGDEVLVPDPSYFYYASVIKIMGGVPCHFPLNKNEDYGLNVEEVKKRIKPRSKAIILCNPNNPTGSLFDRKSLQELADVAIEKDLIVISDEAYERIIYDRKKHHSMGTFSDMRDRLIITNTLSKTYAMTGLRLGYMIADKDYISEIAKWMGYMVICISSAIQKAGIAALEGNQSCVDMMVKIYDRRRKMMVEGLNEIDGISCKTPQGAFYAFPDISEVSKDSKRFADSLLKESKVATVPGCLFGLGGEGHLRLSFATSQEDIKEGLRRVHQVMNKNKHQIC
jgi:aminotransferase